MVESADSSERYVIIEDTLELRCRARNLVQLYTAEAADMTRLQIEFLELSERQQRSEQRWRYAAPIAVFTAVLVGAVYLLWQNYKNWEEERPWARLVSVASGHSFPLTHNTANVGRKTEGVTTIHRMPFAPSVPGQREVYNAVRLTGVASHFVF